MAVCGLGRGPGLCMCTREGRMCLRSPTVFQVIAFMRLFEDREGNIWVATADGLDRFRDFAVPTISVKQGLSNAIVESVLAARDGSVWLGTDDGLNRWNDGQITIYRKQSSGLPDDGVESLFQDDRGRIWVSHAWRHRLPSRMAGLFP